MEFNPYAAPLAEVTPIPNAPDTSEEVIRRAHINTEATIKTAGILYIISGVAMLFSALNVFVQNPYTGIDGVIIAALFVVMAVGLFWLGSSLRQLKSGARIPGIILSCVGLLGIPIGTIISLLILIRLAGRKGKFVMSPEYRRIIAATPHVKRKIISRPLLILLLVLAALVIGTVVVSKISR